MNISCRYPSEDIINAAEPCNSALAQTVDNNDDISRTLLCRALFGSLALVTDLCEHQGEISDFSAVLPWPPA
jgi:hypothetical protein